MNKADRQVRSTERSALIQKAELQEKAMRAFFDECRACMPGKTWTQYYEEAKRSAGETFHIFEHLIFALGATQIPIAPRLRKAIDVVLECCEIERGRMAELKKLNYDKYWKGKYGYS